MRIGIDLGGTKIEGILLDDSGAERRRQRVPTPRSYDGTIGAIVRLVTDLDQHAGIKATVGLGIPGAVTESTGLVKNANSVWLIGQPLVRDLSTQLDRDVRVRNDADCFALSEATDGAAAGAAIVFGVILGTGVGGGLIIHGHCVQGPNLITGEWGHNPLPWPTPEEFNDPPSCYCGKSGCIEAWLSGPGFAHDHLRRSGHALAPVDILAAAQTLEAHALFSVETYQHRLARALATIVNVIDPHIIVLGGGMSNVPRLAETLTRHIAQWVFSDTVLTRVVKNQHGDSSGVRGAAWLWPRNTNHA